MVLKFHVQHDEAAGLQHDEIQPGQDFDFCLLSQRLKEPVGAIFPLTNCYLETCKRVIGKQCRPISDFT